MNLSYRFPRTRVKICGFTRQEDARKAAQLGVDALGLVFYPQSPRNVEIGEARAIVEGLPPFVTVVALFVDEAPERIREVLRQVPVDLVQFHGDEPPDYCRAFGMPFIKALRMGGAVDVEAVADRYREAAGLLLDAFEPGARGGTGNRFDWDRVPARCSLPIVLAGGLTPDNVTHAVRRVKPYAVDVSSGVEAAKGIKDPAKMAAFLKEVYHCECTDR